VIKRFILSSIIIFILLTLASYIMAQNLYWENSVAISPGNTRFPVTAGTDDTSVVVWQEIEETGDKKGRIWLSAQIFSATAESGWITNSRFAGPFTYSGEVPNLFSVAVNDQGVISVAVLAGTNVISLFTSANQGASFVESKLTQGGTSLVAPRIFKTIGDGFVLFATQGDAQSFTLKISRSLDGITWSNFIDFTPSNILANSFIPTLTVLPNGRELVVFQSAHTANNRITYQLYSTYSDDNGLIWSDAVLVTSTEAIGGVFTEYSNQRPYLHTLNGKIFLGWERLPVTSSNTAIFLTEISRDGRIVGKIEQLSPVNASARQSVLFTYNDELAVLWFDTRRGVENIYFARKNGILWDETRISTASIASVFGYPLVTNDGKDLHIFWEQEVKNNEYQVTRLSVDRFADEPILSAVSFTEGLRSTSDRIDVRLSFASDPSGVSGYSWIATQNPTENPPQRFMSFPTENTITTFVEEDGPWYIKARVLDNAGNWSDSSAITYYRDTVPPENPKITPPTIDEGGFQQSNTFNLTWEAADDGDTVAGYTYALDFIAPIQNYIETPENYASENLTDVDPQLPPRVMTKNTIVSWNNRDNGVYLFSVASIDSVGNISEPTSAPVYLNKYIPFTEITTAFPQTDVFGTVSLNIFGKGFTYDGVISAVYIDRDGVAPYDKVFELATDDFTINSDTQITGIEFSDLEEGTYRIGLLHTNRGLYMSRAILSVTEFGTVKTGDYTYRFIPNWNEITQVYDYTLQVSDIILWTVVVFAIFGMIFAIRGIMMTAKDAVTVQHEVHSLITGGSMPFEQKQKGYNLKKRGMSLKLKMMSFTSILVLMVILLVSIPLGYIFVRSQTETLASGLEARVGVLMESLSAGVKNFMPSQNILELELLLNQTTSMSEIEYATIIGLPADGSNTNMDYVWASNDPDILTKIDSENLINGSSRFTADVIKPIVENALEINIAAVDQVGKTAENITSLTTEGLALRTDDVSVARLEEIQLILTQLNESLTIELSELSELGSGSSPQFSNAQLSTDFTDYVFYKPVLYRQGSEQTYVRAIVLLRLSTENLLEVLRDAQIEITRTASLIALLAITIGVIGALFLASVIIKPIRRLSIHVEMIRDTEDKSTLEGKDIKITSHDEIGNLGEIVNDMTHGLVKAAAATKDLTVGKEVQKMFIPLSTDERGKKLTTGAVEDENAQFFGYYEGAKGVSGDYFDYLKLDDRHFAVIKCDVSGKGVPAALIMVEVATLFLNYFKDWTYKRNGYRLRPIVGQINDLIESRGFQGRFAAFTLCIFDSISGDVHFCNAGDNLIHLYDASEGRKKIIALTATPASGVFPTSMVDMKGGFVVEKIHLDKGDVLFLYTDGIEEAKRMFRDNDYKIIPCAEPGLKEGDIHGFHLVGQDGEEMAPDRVNAIIEAVFARTTYSLIKYHNIDSSEEIIFDFSTCEGNAEDVIMALVSVEKIFRMYNHPKATEFDRVQVDRKIDEFLKDHFLQYTDYCSNTRDHQEFKEYMYYTKIKEDDQYDDLTLVAIKKK